MKVSVLILTYNEQANLGACLATLGWCDDVLVLDSGSTDATVSMAQQWGARILSRPFDNFAAQRNFGLEHGALRHEFVLHLDADEVLTAAFVQGLEALQPSATIDGYNVPSKTYLWGKWLRYSGMYPTYQVRLGHRDRLRFIQVGHGQQEALPPERVGVFDEPYIHHNFSRGIRAWLEKHVRYAGDEAELIMRQRQEPAEATKADGSSAKRRRAKQRAAKLPLWLRPMARFIYVYLLKRGFRDGMRGFTYAFMLSVYEAMIAILTYEIKVEARTESPDCEKLTAA